MIFIIIIYIHSIYSERKLSHKISTWYLLLDIYTILWTFKGSVEGIITLNYSPIVY